MKIARGYIISENEFRKFVRHWQKENKQETTDIEIQYNKPKNKQEIVIENSSGKTVSALKILHQYVNADIDNYIVDNWTVYAFTSKNRKKGKT